MVLETKSLKTVTEVKDYFLKNCSTLSLDKSIKLVKKDFEDDP
jgi:hypothetical protein